MPDLNLKLKLDQYLKKYKLFKSYQTSFNEIKYLETKKACLL